MPCMTASPDYRTGRCDQPGQRERRQHHPRLQLLGEERETEQDPREHRPADLAAVQAWLGLEERRQSLPYRPIQLPMALTRARKSPKL